jgi:DNA-binding transcriptional LysR family regulator
MVVHPQGEADALEEMCPSPTVPPIRPEHAITQLPDLGLLLSRVLPAWDLGTVEAYAVYANGNAIKPAARAFIDFLAHDFRDTPP